MISPVNPAKIKKSAPYWNFWKVVFAGWLIRYPKTMGKIAFITLGILIALIYNAYN